MSEHCNCVLQPDPPKATIGVRRFRVDFNDVEGDGSLFVLHDGFPLAPGDSAQLYDGDGNECEACVLGDASPGLVVKPDMDTWRPGSD